MKKATDSPSAEPSAPASATSTRLSLWPAIHATIVMYGTGTIVVAFAIKVTMKTPR